ncbi:hypothetical protein K474DRAFT_1711328 [Panus rudis PR-1116 ss-1]|nr:hypothetical protein K474DRAFT_1711328 [Panus rudis PR-1116 ss-1]
MSRNRKALFDSLLRSPRDDPVDSQDVERMPPRNIWRGYKILLAASLGLSPSQRIHLTNSPGNLSLTEEGFDIQWGTNVVGPYLFTKSLLPALLAGAAQSPDKKARVTGSDEPDQKLSADKRYAQSKFANVVLAKEFARRYSDKGLIAFSLNPGGIKTGLQRNLPGIFRALVNPLLYPAAMGALTHLWGATTAKAEDVNGKYLIPWARIGTPVPESQRPEVGEQLWNWLEEHTKEA